MECTQVRSYLPAYAESDAQLRMKLDSHMVDCRGCSAELNIYRSLSTELADLRQLPAETPAWLASTISEVVAERARRIQALKAQARKAADPKVLAGSAVLIAGVAGALVLRSRRRRRRGFGTRLRGALAGT